MRVLLCTSDKLGSRIIRAVTWSRWSHAAIIDGDEIVEAVWPRVRLSTLSDALASHPRWAVIDIPVADEAAAIAAARSQIGKPYDLLGVIGLGKIGKSRVHDDSPAIMGMIKKVSYLLKVENLQGE